MAGFSVLEDMHLSSKKRGGITIVGLGPGKWEHLTLEAATTLSQCNELYVRTARHPTLADLPHHVRLHSFDHVYEHKDSFAQVYETIACEVVRLGERPQGVVYAVPGHPMVAEESVQLILAQASAKGVPVRVVAGVSFIEPTLTALKLDPVRQGLQLVDAMTLASVLRRDRQVATPQGDLFRPDDRLTDAALLRRDLNPRVPLLISQLYSRELASQVKLGLLELYPPEHAVTLVQAAGVEKLQSIATLPLHELDRHEMDHLTCLYVPQIAAEQDRGSFEVLTAIIARLRGPTGCPWDRQQTHESLKQYLVEEAYEVLEAIDSGDPDKLAEELGDLLLQILLHAQIASECNDFSMEEVIAGIGTKLMRRHPHVFGQAKVSSAAEVALNWEQIKRAERGNAHSAISAVPKHLPALAYAQAAQRRAARTGFDWADISGVLEKVNEEIRELTAAKTKKDQKAELGDLLFALVNLARWLEIDAEDALRQANRRFLLRFQRMEQLAAERGEDFSQLRPSEQDCLWQQAKRERS